MKSILFEKKLFIIVSILFGCCFYFEVQHGDDASALALSENTSLFSIFSKVISMIKTRGLVSFTGVLFILFNNLPRIFFVIFMASMMYILLFSISKLIDIENNIDNKYLYVFICASVLTYPYIDMQSAGWIVTSCCYFVPIVFSIASLIPIKRFIKNEQLTSYEMIKYSLVLIAAINGAPQGVAYMGFIYGTLLFYCLIKNRKYSYNYFFLLIIIIFGIATLTNGSNINRIPIETIKRMPSISMYNLITKIDIGLFSSLGWLIFGSNWFIPFSFMILSILIYEKFHSIKYVFISFIPEVIRIILKKLYLNNLSINAFEISPKELGTSNFGLFNINSVSNFSTYLLFFGIYLIIIINLFEIYLLSNKRKTLVEILIIILAGFVSRFVLTFTPNIFGSQQRTFIYLDFSIIITIIILFSNNISIIKIDKKKIIFILCLILVFVCLMYLFVYVYNYMGHSIFDIFR